MPQLTTAVDAPKAPEKKKLELGGIAPHLGEIWGFEILPEGVLWPRL